MRLLGVPPVLSPRQQGRATPVLKPSTPGVVSHPCPPSHTQTQAGVLLLPCLVLGLQGWPSCLQPLKMPQHKARTDQCSRPRLRIHTFTHPLLMVSHTSFSFWGMPASWMSGPFPYQLLGFLLCVMEEWEQILLASLWPTCQRGGYVDRPL